MPEKISIKTPQALHIRRGSFTYHGANQVWYPTTWQRRAGCGPTACAHLLYYLARTRPEHQALCPYGPDGRQDFMGLMGAVWDYVTPGRMGVNKTDMLADGGVRYAAERGVALESRLLEVPCSGRPGREELTGFLRRYLQRDLPVAFLNLSNGALKNLDNWHWVTIISFEPETLQAEMYDQGRRSVIDLALWLRTTKLGGGFVVLEPQ